jgi:natural product biosynthesis luciferase-like monooxygenase protein
MDLSVMFFGADSSATSYEDLLAIARAADELGFTAVWTPERHFQRFGQIFPSPAVLSAALAVATKRIGVRAGSVVLPLHHPVRVAEDWAVVDNLSGGRVGLSIATGWHSTDFVLAPDHYNRRREFALGGIPLLRRLWAGEEVTLPDGTSTPVSVRPGPRPVSPALPLWLTASGSIRTWLTAGRLRTNVLAATAGQTRAELAEKIRCYREAYASSSEPGAAPGPGVVTLMAHTYVGTDDADARRTVSGPLRGYLKSYVAQTASNADPNAASGALADADPETVAQFALRRYLSWGSLFGSPETCAASLADLRDLGCDEVACFVDFGLSLPDVLASLYRLAQVRKEIAA